MAEGEEKKEIVIVQRENDTDTALGDYNLVAGQHQPESHQLFPDV